MRRAQDRPCVCVFTMLGMDEHLPLSIYLTPGFCTLATKSAAGVRASQRRATNKRAERSHTAERCRRVECSPGRGPAGVGSSRGGGARGGQGSSPAPPGCRASQAGEATGVPTDPRGRPPPARRPGPPAGPSARTNWSTTATAPSPWYPPSLVLPDTLFF